MSTQRSRLNDERGMALIGVILLLILASGVCAALAVSGKTETTAAYNNDTSAQARAAAEAGLTAAIEVVLDTLNSSPLDPVPAVNALLAGPDGVAGTADDGSLWKANEIAPPGVAQALGSLLGVSFETQAFDDDDTTNRGLVAGSINLTEIDEDGVTTTSQNRRLVIRSIGRGRNNTTVRLEAILSTTTFPAIVADGDIHIGGNVTIAGANGGVHANGNVTTTGNSFSIAEDLTATGLIEDDAEDNVGGDTVEGQPALTVPSLLADWADLESHTDYYLGTDGMIRNQDGTPATIPAGSAGPGCLSVAACEAAFGWHWEGGGNWSLNTTPPSGTYYSYGSVTITGSPGPGLAMSLLAEGDIDIQGSPELQPNTEPGFDTLFATQGDLEISGALETPVIEGVVRVLGQLNITGNPTIAGQVLIENEAVGTLATANQISGTTTITYNGTAGNDTFDVAGWREIK